MRAWLVSLAALAALIALALALRHGGDAREASAPERRAEPAADVRPAAQLADMAELDQGERVAAVVPETAAREQAAAGVVGPQQREPAAQDGAMAELIVTVVAEEDERPLPDVSLFHLPWPPQPMPGRALPAAW